MADYLSNWEQLNPEEYKAKKVEVAQLVFKRLEKIIPGITDCIEYYEVGTAKTIQRYTLNPEGTPYGYAQIPKQSGMGRIPVQSPIKNLYFAGAWTFPGGGFTGTIISGFLCANKVQKSVSKKSRTTLITDDRIIKLISTIGVAKSTIELTFEKPKFFDYVAGQYAVLDIINPKHQEFDIPIRSSSMVSHPDENVLRFAMRLSNSSYKKSVMALKVGDQCRLFGPMGNFSVSTNNKGIVFLISGIGITPVLPLLKELEKAKFSQPVYLFYSNKALETASYHEQLKLISISDYKYIPVFTNS